MSNTAVRDKVEAPPGSPQEVADYKLRLPAIPWKGNLSFGIPRWNRKNGYPEDPSHPSAYYRGGVLDIEPLGTSGYMSRRSFPVETRRSMPLVLEVAPVPSIDRSSSTAEVHLSKHGRIDVDAIREKLSIHGICNQRRVLYTGEEWKKPIYLTGPIELQSPKQDEGSMRVHPSPSPPRIKNEPRLSSIAYSQLKLDNLNLTLVLNRMERDFNAKLHAQDRRFRKITTEHAVKNSELETKLGDCKRQLDR